MPHIPKPLRYLLYPLGLIHRAVIALRHFFYDCGVFKVRRLSRPVISVGNLQLGGTGKTPLVMYLIEELHRAEKTIGVLTRGYRRKTGGRRILISGRDEAPVPEVGDEPALIFRRLRAGDALGIAADRAATGAALLQRKAVDLFLLDDGFQHRKLARDLDICMIDVSTWPGHGLLVPFSTLRDAKTTLRRADVVVLNKWENHSQRVTSIENEVRKQSAAPVLKASYRSAGFFQLADGREIEVPELRTGGCLAFCGLANPGHFFRSLKQEGLTPVVQKAFPDHHDYREADLVKLGGLARNHGVAWLLTSEKDAVKLPAEASAFREAVVVFRIALQLDRPEVLQELVREAIGRDG